MSSSSSSNSSRWGAGGGGGGGGAAAASAAAAAADDRRLSAAAAAKSRRIHELRMMAPRISLQPELLYSLPAKEFLMLVNSNKAIHSLVTGTRRPFKGHPLTLDELRRKHVFSLQLQELQRVAEDVLREPEQAYELQQSLGLMNNNDVGRGVDVRGQAGLPYVTSDVLARIIMTYAYKIGLVQWDEMHSGTALRQAAELLAQDGLPLEGELKVQIKEINDERTDFAREINRPVGSFPGIMVGEWGVPQLTPIAPPVEVQSAAARKVRARAFLHKMRAKLMPDTTDTQYRAAAIHWAQQTLASMEEQLDNDDLDNSYFDLFVFVEARYVVIEANRHLPFDPATKPMFAQLASVWKDVCGATIRNWPVHFEYLIGLNLNHTDDDGRFIIWKTHEFNGKVYRGRIRDRVMPRRQRLNVPRDARLHRVYPSDPAMINYHNDEVAIASDDEMSDDEMSDDDFGDDLSDAE